MNLRLLISALLLAAASPLFAADTNILKNSRTGPFILGAEVSWAPEDEADSAKYFDHGVKKDIFEILKEYKLNYIRLRLFVNPSSTNGYARRRPEAFCDLEHVKALAKRAKTAGAANTNSPEAVFRSFGTNENARADWRKRRFGGHYDANDLFNLYPQMSHDYGNR